MKPVEKFAHIFLFASLLAAVIPLAAEEPGIQRVVFFGDSITEGLGVGRSNAFPAKVEEKIRAQGWPFQVVNAGLSGDTSAAGRRRLDWLLKQPIDVLIVELGANDGLRGLPVEQTQENLKAIVQAARKKNPEMTVLLAEMQMPPNLTAEYGARFERTFAAVAAQTGATLIPKFLDGVGGIAAMNQEDQIHPTAEGHALLAETVWKTLEPVLKARMAAPK